MHSQSPHREFEVMPCRGLCGDQGRIIGISLSEKIYRWANVSTRRFALTCLTPSITRSGLSWTPHSTTRSPVFSLGKSQADARDESFNLQQRLCSSVSLLRTKKASR